MTNSRTAVFSLALAFLWTPCGIAAAPKAHRASSIKQEVLSLNFTNNGQRLRATVGQQIEITLGTVGPSQYGTPLISSPCIRLENIALDWPPNPGGGPPPRPPRQMSKASVPLLVVGGLVGMIALIGMVVIVPPERAAATVEFLTAHGETARVVGEVRAGARGVFIHA